MLLFDSPAPGIARITLNRPAAMNAYSFAMTQELRAAIAAFRDDDAQKVLILTNTTNTTNTLLLCKGGEGHRTSKP
jgi:enoyl-CoA hydratase/carnithine racemase